MRTLRSVVLVFTAIGLAWACPFDESLREYLDAHFWLPFAKHAANFEHRGVRRISAPFAGMVKGKGDSPLEKLRAAYQAIPVQEPYAPPVTFDPAPARQALAMARADRSLKAKDREEVDLIDAKIDMRAGDLVNPEPLQTAKQKFQQFLKTARTPEFLSEARGWLAHVDYLLGDRTSAGKIYLDELNRNGSNLNRETLLNSLRINYGYDGGPDLLAHLDDYFDTPEHAAFAIQLVTNPHWPNYGEPNYENTHYGVYRPRQPEPSTQAYPRIEALLEKHRDLLQSQTGSSALALLSMRTALRMGDPPGALSIAAMLPANSPTRSEPDFLWMLASSQFLSHDYSSAEKPLVALFRSASSTTPQKEAAAYGLVGVYRQLGNPVEEIHYALLTPSSSREDYGYPSQGPEDMSVYWAESGWDLNLLLDSEAPIDALSQFLARFPNAPVKQTQLVKYSLAVRLARENKYGESAGLYQSIGVPDRATRMRRLASLYQDAIRSDLAPAALPQAKFKLAEFIASNEDRLYFNDRLWEGVQRYALYANADYRLDGAQRQAAVNGERKLKDDQEEYWRAYLILRDVVGDSGKAPLGRQAAQLAIRCLRRINQDRFGRQDDIRNADIQLSKWLREP